MLGDVMEDIIVLPEGAMVPGSDRSARIESHAGGSGANQAAWLAHFGVPVRFVGKVGAKDAARLRAEFGAQKIDAELSVSASRPTGRLVTLIDPTGERSFFTDRGANLELSAEDVPEDLLARASLGVVSGYSFFAPGPRQAAQKLLDRATQSRCPAVVDAASVGYLQQMGSAPFLKAAKGAFGLFANDAEAQVLTGEQEPEKQLCVLLRHFALVVIKRGSKGAVAQMANDLPVEAKAASAATVDSTGAGDAFLAGFVAAWRRGAPLAGALERANAAGAEAVTRIGGRP